MRTGRGRLSGWGLLGVPLVALGMASLTACGSGSSATAASGSTGAASPSSSASSDGAVHPGRSLLIKAADLGDGWRDSNPPSPGFRMQVCGVDTEPVRAATSARARFAKSALGPFLYEHVRVHESEQTPRQVLDSLAAALPTCTQFTTRGGDGSTGPEATFALAPLQVTGLPSGAVAWRMTPANGSPVQDVVMIARDRRLVAFVSMDPAATPDTAVLERAVAALAALP